MIFFSVLCGDFTYVILFPQLLLVLYFSKSNTYGSLTSFMICLTLRLLAGDVYLGIPPVISFGIIKVSCPTEEDLFKECEGDVPFRTIIMLVGLVFICDVWQFSIFIFVFRLFTLLLAEWLMLLSVSVD